MASYISPGLGGITGPSWRPQSAEVDVSSSFFHISHNWPQKHDAGSYPHLWRYRSAVIVSSSWTDERKGERVFNPLSILVDSRTSPHAETSQLDRGHLWAGPRTLIVHLISPELISHCAKYHPDGSGFLKLQATQRLKTLLRHNIRARRHLRRRN